MSIQMSDPTDNSLSSSDAPADASPPPDKQRGVGEQRSKRAARAFPRWLDWRIGSVLLLALVSIPIWRMVTSHARERTTQTLAPAAQSVAVARVTREDLFNEIPIPAEFRPYLKVELHAKVSGYVEQIKVPELKDELNRAMAAKKRAEADYKDAHLVYTRLVTVEKEHPNLVAQQELDAAEAKDGTTEAAIAGAKAEVGRCQTLLDYTRITAPFDGVITHRYADPGSLIQAGTTSDTQSMPLVCLSDNYRLRLDFPVSVAYVKDIHVGDQVEGTITRATLRVNEDTRTMTTEIEVPNASLTLVPGMYAEVVLKVQRRPQALAVPIEAVPPGQTSSVYVINDQGQIEERPVKLGLDTPTKCEVTAGLKEGELVLVGSRSQVHPGQKVEAKITGQIAKQ